MNSNSWKAIFDKYEIIKHDFNAAPYIINAEQIKQATKHFTKTKEREVRILCFQDKRESRPDIFIENNLFILPIRNGEYAIIKGEGYVDIPEIQSVVKIYKSKLDFKLDTSFVGSSEMQHIDFAYASSLIRTFLEDDSLILTIRGRKRTPQLSFKVNNHEISVKGVQTEVDAGYEGKNQIVLIEAKNSKTKNTVIRQLFYPYRQWQQYTEKQVKTLFFEMRANYYSLWQFEFQDMNNYNSIILSKSQRYEII
ncbi:MAG: hypothetical protein LBI45_06170 [Bacteroidales bacterium]|jgi:hypothetical protein|nr:hypothetical protein [Bacteroidales bacterium]